MAEKRLLFIDIEPKSNSSASASWTRSDNTFRFNFVPVEAPAPQGERSRPQGLEQAPRQISLEQAPRHISLEQAPRHTSFTRAESAFAFNFQVPAASSSSDVEMAESPGAGCEDAHGSTQTPQPSTPQEVNAPAEPQSKAAKKKKKKSGKPKESSGAEARQEQAEGNQGGQDTELSAEEQLNRQLDWCIEQLEHGLRTQKGTPKQKEEATRALKTLRSSKAPLVKKRQVMRAMGGEYRKKMEEEKNKQFKLIQSEMTSAQVKVVSDSPKKCVFNRKAKVKAPGPAAVDSQPDSQTPDTDPTPETQEEAAAFVLTPSKEEFRFNFL